MKKILEIINDWQVKGFLFDFDGTLVDTVDAYLQTYVELFRERFREEIPPEQIIVHFGKPAYRIIRDATKRNLTDDEIRHLIKRREEILLSRHLDKIKIIDGVFELLEFLREQNMKLAIVTSSTRSMLTAIAKRFNLLRWFDATVTADDVRKGKPDPEPFIKATEFLGLSIKEVIAIGDTTYDIISAKGAGIKIIFLERNANSNFSFIPEKPELVIKSFRELL